MINTYADLGMPAAIPGSGKVVFGLVASENGFRVMGYDIPGLTEGGIAGAGATRRENGHHGHRADGVRVDKRTDARGDAGLVGSDGGQWHARPAAGGFGVERGVRVVSCAVAGLTSCSSRPPDLSTFRANWFATPPHALHHLASPRA